MPKRAEWRTIYKQLYEPDNWKHWVSPRTIRGLRRVKCPQCSNSDMEKICKLRNDFYECEVCGYKFDKDVV